MTSRNINPAVQTQTTVYSERRGHFGFPKTVTPEEVDFAEQVVFAERVALLEEKSRTASAARRYINSPPSRLNSFFCCLVTGITGVFDILSNGRLTRPWILRDVRRGLGLSNDASLGEIHEALKMKMRGTPTEHKN